MKPMFNEFDFGGGHRKLFEDESNMDFLGRGNENFIAPNFFSVDEQN